MFSTIVVPIATIGYGLCGIAYVILLLLLASRSRGEGSGRLLLLAVVAEILWSFEHLLLPAQGGSLLRVDGLVEALRVGAWIGFMLSLLTPPRNVVILALLSILFPPAVEFLGLGKAIFFSMQTMVVVVALVCVEQVWRNTAINRRWAMKFLCLALLAKFILDLVMYSDALLYNEISAIWSTTRGLANALLVPLFAVSAARNRQWKLDVSVSRQVVFHSATLLASGAFLLAVGLGGYVLKSFGGSWGSVAATMLGFTGLIVVAVLITSGTARAGLRVSLAKHFFSYRYDYRKEWLALTRNLGEADLKAENKPSEPSSASALAQRGLKSLADLVESPGGALWLKAENGTFHCESRAGRTASLPSLCSDDPWLMSLRQEGHILDLRSARSAASEKDRQAGEVGGVGTSGGLPDWLTADTKAAFMVPLLLDEELVGVALLDRPRVPIDLDWEARDLLRVAARQVASYLTLRRTVEALVQARQFESFNRTSAFVVHDLKNLIAQLSLMVGNAERHKGNPAFQEDMLETVQNVLERMRGLMLQLGVSTKPLEAPRGVVLVRAIRDAVRAKETSRPAVQVMQDPSLEHLEVTAHKDRLERVLGHLIQNAIEATDDEGSVVIRTSLVAKQVVIDITDDGPGMSEEFLREHLFKPFTSTKDGGMGIGVFECREYVRELSGSLEVSSSARRGTTFTVRLPIRMHSNSPRIASRTQPAEVETSRALNKLIATDHR